MMYGITNLKN